MPTFERSPRKNKKYRTVYQGKIIDFGDQRFGQYFDKIGLYSNQNHNDEKRRRSYLKRAMAIKDKNGNLTYLDPSSPNYYSVNLLW
jgi:hypothetical protein